MRTYHKIARQGLWHIAKQGEHTGLITECGIVREYNPNTKKHSSYRHTTDIAEVGDELCLNCYRSTFEDSMNG